MADPAPIPPFAAASPHLSREESERGLRALLREYEAQTDSGEQAWLSQELARQQERLGDLAAAARDALHATNLAGGFVEPLETLLSIALRNRSGSNAAKLLARLTKVTPHIEVLQRAALEQLGRFVEGDEWDAARQLVAERVAQFPEEPSWWLFCELVAAAQGDRDEANRAAVARAELSQDPVVRAVLFQRVACSQAETGALTEALETLQRALDERPTLDGLKLAERWSLEGDDHDARRDYARQIAALVDLAIADPGSLESEAVDAYDRHPDQANAARLRIAVSFLEQSQLDEAHEGLLDLAKRAPREHLVLGLLHLLHRNRDATPEDLWTVLRDACEADRGALIHLAATEALARFEGADPEAALELAINTGTETSAARQGLCWALDPRYQPIPGLAELLERLSDVRSVNGQEGPATGERAEMLIAAAVLHLVAGQLDRCSQALDRALVQGWDQRVAAPFRFALGALADPARPAAQVDDQPAFFSARLREAFLSEHSRVEEYFVHGPATGWLDQVQRLLLARFQRGEYANVDASALWRALVRNEEVSEVAEFVRAASDVFAEHGVEHVSALFHAAPDDAFLAGCLLAQQAVSGAPEAAETAALAAAHVDDEGVATELRMRAAVLWLSRGDSAQALPLMTELAELQELQPLLPWFERAFRSQPLELASWPRSTDIDASSQLEAAAEMVRRRDPELPALLEEPRSSAAALLKLLVALGSGPRKLEEILNGSVALSPHVRGALLFAAGAQAPEPLDTLLGARRWVELSPGLESQLAWVVAARLNGDTDEERQAWCALAEQLDSPSLQIAATNAGGTETSPHELDALLKRLESISPPARAPIAWQLLEDSKDCETEVRARLLIYLADCLEHDPDGVTARLDGAFLLMSLGKWEAACNQFVMLQEVIPDDPTLWFGLARAAYGAERLDLEATALSELARREADPARAARYWERAGDLHEMLDELREAEAAFSAALGRVPGSPHAFQRLYHLARRTGDRGRMVELIDARLDGSPSTPIERQLLWRKARLCRGLGRRTASLKALEHLLVLDPDHLGALALSAELHLVDARHAEAADLLSQIAAHPDAPAEQRRRAGLFASELFEKLGRAQEALAIVDRLSVPPEEASELLLRKARAAAQAGQWDFAYERFAELSRGEDPERRLAAARLMLAIQRDHLREPWGLHAAAKAVLQDAPEDEDALDVALTLDLEAEEREEWFGPARRTIYEQLRAHPLDPPRIARLAQLSAGAALERTALGLLALTTPLETQQAARLADLTELAAPLPHARLSDVQVTSVLPDARLLACSALTGLLCPALTRALQPSIEDLGLGPSSRTDPFSGDETHQVLTSWFSAFGAGEFELYRGGAAEGASWLCGAVPTIILGQALVPELTPAVRARLLAYAVTHLRGLTPLLLMSHEQACRWLAAAQKLDEDLETDAAPAEGAEGAPADDEAMVLRKHLDAEQRTAVAEAARQARDPETGLDWVSLVIRETALRVACLVHGDASVARLVPDFLPDDAQLRRELLAELVRFALSEEMRELRSQLGLEEA